MMLDPRASSGGSDRKKNDAYREKEKALQEGKCEADEPGDDKRKRCDKEENAFELRIHMAILTP